MKTFNRHDYAMQLRSYALAIDDWFNMTIAETECELAGRQVTWLW